MPSHQSRDSYHIDKCVLRFSYLYICPFKGNSYAWNDVFSIARSSKDMLKVWLVDDNTIAKTHFMYYLDITENIT